jgi:hypothetical protein
VAHSGRGAGGREGIEGGLGGTAVARRVSLSGLDTLSASLLFVFARPCLCVLQPLHFVCVSVPRLGLVTLCLFGRRCGGLRLGRRCGGASDERDHQYPHRPGRHPGRECVLGALLPGARHPARWAHAKVRRGKGREGGRGGGLV